MAEDTRVTMFTTCLVDQAFPEVATAVVSLLRRTGAQVEYPEQQVCCGQPFFNSGFIPEARKMAQQTILALKDAEVVVVPSGSCTAMIRKEYPRLFADDPNWQAQAEALSAKTYELSEYLADRLAPLGDEDTQAKGKVTYHDSCHTCRHLGIHEQPRELLRTAGYQLVEMEESDRCCGFGGLFFVQMPEVSEAMTGEKLRQAVETGVEVLVTADPGCLMKMRLENHSKLQIKHLAEVLYREDEPCK